MVVLLAYASMPFDDSILRRTVMVLLKKILFSYFRRNQLKIWIHFAWPKIDKKKSFKKKKNRIWDRFVIILLSCDASQIIEIISGDIWESMISYEWKTPVADGYIPTIPVLICFMRNRLLYLSLVKWIIWMVMREIKDKSSIRHV